MCKQNYGTKLPLVLLNNDNITDLVRVLLLLLREWEEVGVELRQTPLPGEQQTREDYEQGGVGVRKSIFSTVLNPILTCF